MITALDISSAACAAGTPGRPSCLSTTESIMVPGQTACRPTGRRGAGRSDVSWRNLEPVLNPPAIVASHPRTDPRGGSGEIGKWFPLTRDGDSYALQRRVATRREDRQDIRRSCACSNLGVLAPTSRYAFVSPPDRDGRRAARPMGGRGGHTYYVATTGSDSNAGTMAAPFASWAKAQSAAAAGDTVYFRGGRYKYSDATGTCGGSTSATVNAVVLSKSGTSGSPINYFAYPGEKPVFDFSGITDTSKYNCRQAGVRVDASWLHLKGLEFTGTLQLNNLNHESWCVYVTGGSNNVFELLDAHHNMGPGFFIGRGATTCFSTATRTRTTTR